MEARVSVLPLVAALLVSQALPFQPPSSTAVDKRQQRLDSIAVRPSAAKPQSLWAKTKKAVNDTVHRLWEKDESHTTEGNLASLNGEVDKALQKYDEAQKVLPQSSDSAATLAFNRSSALLKGPPEDAQKALEQAQTARESSDPELRAKAAYNAGVALEQAGKPDEAIKAYANALSLDSNDVDSKVNLELLLQEHEKKKPQSGGESKDQKQQPQQDKDQQQQQSKGEQDQKKNDEKKDEQKGEQKKDEQQAQDQKPQDQKDAKAQDKEDKKDEKGQAAQQQDDKKDGEKPKDQQEKTASIGRSEAQRLLDAARAGEKNLQMWRFGKKAEQHKPRSASEKDW
jgi:tetratricopeptide (TPR) repeat protein